MEYWPPPPKAAPDNVSKHCLLCFAFLSSFMCRCIVYFLSHFLSPCSGKLHRPRYSPNEEGLPQQGPLPLRWRDIGLHEDLSQEVDCFDRRAQPGRVFPQLLQGTGRCVSAFSMKVESSFQSFSSVFQFPSFSVGIVRITICTMYTCRYSYTHVAHE